MNEYKQWINTNILNFPSGYYKYLSIIGPPNHILFINNEAIQLSQRGILELQDINITSLNPNNAPQGKFIVDYYI